MNGRLIILWVVVGAPLAWGITKTLENALIERGEDFFAVLAPQRGAAPGADAAAAFAH